MPKAVWLPKQMVKFVRDNADFKPTMKETATELVDLVYKPVRTYLDNCAYTTAVDINPDLRQTLRHGPSPDEGHP